MNENDENDAKIELVYYNNRHLIVTEKSKKYILKKCFILFKPIVDSD